VALKMFHFLCHAGAIDRATPLPLRIWGPVGYCPQAPKYVGLYAM
jgi:hypothetical protein